MPPATPKLNLIADAIVTALATIDSVADSANWFTKPAAIHREFAAADVTAARPLLVVRFVRCPYEPLDIGGVHRGRAQFEIDAGITVTEHFGAKLIEIGRDIRRAIALNETLNGHAREVRVTSEDTDPEGRSVFGQEGTTVSVEVEFEHDHTTF